MARYFVLPGIEIMATGRELYRPWMIAGTVFSRMLQCSQHSNDWLEHALTRCLPYEILEQWQDRIAYISAEQRDAFRINKALRESRELIFLSEHIAPSQGMNEADPIVRYFIFVCLHETVHAIKQHRPPNEITPKENEAQEAEADQLALEWINSYLKEMNHPDMPLLTKEEIERAQARNRALMNSRCG
jgi:Zn-dependent peptidase ImmA (M78 family)